MSHQKCEFIGKLGADPELKYLPDGTAVATFSIATSTAFHDKNGEKQETTEWHRIVVWGKRAESCNKYLSKGKTVFIEAKAKTRVWTGKDDVKRYTTEYHAFNTLFLTPQGKKVSESVQSNSESSNQEKMPSTPTPDISEGSLPHFTADDIPF